jgi:peptide/nickel transport system ATP-binding protein
MRGLRSRALVVAAVSPAVSFGPMPLVSMQGVVKSFAGRKRRAVEALKGVSIEVWPGESVGLVGESGSGKTTLGRCLVGLETPTSGKIRIAGIDSSDFRSLTPSDRMQIRRTIQMVFQDPYSTLNPRHSVRRSLSEALRAAAVAGDPETRIRHLLNDVGLPEDYVERRPASLSGGERQRVAVARSLAVSPKILLCDEPVSALDVSVQAQILNLFKRLRDEHGLSYLFISHDLAVVRQVVDRLYVLYLGEIVESGPTEEVMGRPRHPYTRRLLESIPRSTTF